MRGRGQGFLDTKAPLRPIEVNTQQLKSLKTQADVLRESLAGNFLVDLRAGQRKLTPEQVAQLEKIETVGSVLHEQVIKLQRDYYGTTIEQTAIELQRAKDKLNYMTEQRKNATKEFEQHWKEWGEDVDFATSWQYSKDRDEKNKRYSVRAGDYIWEEFDEERYQLGMHHDEIRNANLKKEGKMRRAEMAQKDEVKRLTRRQDQIDGLTYGAILQKLMGEVRAIGGAEARKLSVSFEHSRHKDHKLSDERTFRTFLRAMEHFPKDWLEQMIDHRRNFGIDMRLGYYGDFSSAHAHHEHVQEGNENYSVVRMNELYFCDRLNGERENYTEKDLQEDRFWQDHLHAAFTHEIMHHMEMVKPELGRAGNAYRVLRSMQKEPLKVKYARRDYRKDLLKKMRERSEDKISKNEQAHLDWKHSEVLTTSLESMVAGSHRGKDIKQDDRHRAFTLGCMLVL